LTTFRSLSGDHHAERWIPQVLPWLQEAGDPYYHWFFGGIVPAERTPSLLAGWVRRRSSELSIERAVLLVTGDCALGGFIALGGADLQACRRADARGAADGFRRFRLDVWAENRPAIGLYRAFGFQVVRELRNERAGMTHLNMALELREDDEGRSIRERD
jgi:hypothetical protein